MNGGAKRISGWVAGVLIVLLVHSSEASAHADVVEARPHERTVMAADGRILRVGHRAENIELVAGGSSSERTALVGNEAYATVTGAGSAPLSEAELRIGYHVGCAVAVSKFAVELGALLSAIGVSMDQKPFARRSTIVVKPDEGGPKRNRSRIYPGLRVEPEVTVNLDVGTVADIPLATSEVHDSVALAGIERTRITVDGCLGPAAVRSYAALTTKSALADETVVVYGDPVLL
ncbi:MspA family porin [Nocardia sp. NPDC051750]|uniref:MspA family porin n=1 Tax=Nocardia sp. NPDC051750 TaxID=3364325 RepID=UPI00379D2A66